MEPITTLIVSAIVLGAAAGLKSTTEQVIKDAYSALRKVIADHYSDYHDLLDSMHFLEKKPEDSTRQAIVTDEFRKVDVQNDTDLIQAAKTVHYMIQKYQPEILTSIGMNIEELNAAKLEVEKVHPPANAGIGVRIGKAEIKETASFKDIGTGTENRIAPN